MVVVAVSGVGIVGVAAGAFFLLSPRGFSGSLSWIDDAIFGILGPKLTRPRPCVVVVVVGVVGVAEDPLLVYNYR